MEASEAEAKVLADVNDRYEADSIKLEKQLENLLSEWESQTKVQMQCRQRLAVLEDKIAKLEKDSQANQGVPQTLTAFGQSLESLKGSMEVLQGHVHCNLSTQVIYSAAALAVGIAAGAGLYMRMYGRKE